MHFFGQIRRGIVDDDGLRLFGFADAQMAAVQRAGKVLRQKVGAQAQVDETRAGNFRAFNHMIARQFVGHLLRQLARIAVMAFGGGHHAVDLIVAVLGVFGRLQNNRAGSQPAGGKGGFYFGGNGLGEFHNVRLSCFEAV